MLKNSSWLMSVLVLMLGLGVGLSIGASIWGGKNPLAFLALDNDNINKPIGKADFVKKPQEQLVILLSEMMMPKEEHAKILAAITQTGMGLMSAQSQGSDLNITQGVETQLRGRIENRYSLKYFIDMNAKSMKDLSKYDLEAILYFYNTPPGEKFFKLSPQIIENTLKSAQTDVASWLPAEINKMLDEMKFGLKVPPKKEQDKS